MNKKLIADLRFIARQQPTVKYGEEDCLNAIAITMENAANYIAKFERRIASQQAKIDALMLEYCPDEMTEDQMANWAKHQVPASPDAELALEKAGRDITQHVKE